MRTPLLALFALLAGCTAPPACYNENPLTTSCDACLQVVDHAELVEEGCSERGACPWNPDDVAGVCYDVDLATCLAHADNAATSCDAFWQVLETDETCSRACPHL